MLLDCAQGDDVISSDANPTYSRATRHRRQGRAPGTRASTLRSGERAERWCQSPCPRWIGRRVGAETLRGPTVTAGPRSRTFKRGYFCNSLRRSTSFLSTSVLRTLNSTRRFFAMLRALEFGTSGEPSP